MEREIEYAYCAGIIDGEGSILISQGKEPGVSVTNTDLVYLNTSKACLVVLFADRKPISLTTNLHGCGLLATEHCV